MTQKLRELGFSPFFEHQTTREEVELGKLARVIEVQRSHLTVNNGGNSFSVSIAGSWFQLRSEERPTIGDWLVLDARREKIERLLTRKSVFQRLAVGKKMDFQLIAANLDLLFIVTSCNDDFNEARIERYLSMALEARIKPVAIITKADLANDSGNYRERLNAMQVDLPVELINARSRDTVNSLSKWISTGCTIGLVGSSGVGKSTLANVLCQKQVAQTADIRTQDAKGRHTTSYRALHQLPNGGVILDLPGMREVKTAELESGVNEVFADIEEVALDCKFTDCGHQHEPHCAVRAAIDNGVLSERRLSNYRKLLEEEKRQTQNLAEQRHRNKSLSKAVRQHINNKHTRKKR